MSNKTEAQIRVPMSKAIFINKEILLEALKECGYKYELKGDKIHIPVLYEYGRTNTYFKFTNGEYVLRYESDNKAMSPFLKRVQNSYNNIYEKKLKEDKEEAERLEKERLEYYKEAHKKTIMERAKAKGYRVMETKKDNKIQLTLVRY